MADTKKRGQKKRRESTRRTEPPDRKTDDRPPQEEIGQVEPAAERGAGLETGKTIARGGKSTGSVPGATENRSEPASSEEAVLPPAPPGESPPEAVKKTRAVSDALAHLGTEATPKELAEYLVASGKLHIDEQEIAGIRSALLEHAKPHGPDPTSAPQPGGGRERAERESPDTTGRPPDL